MDIKKIQERLRVLKEEITMDSYYDGWTLKGLIKEYNEKKALLENLKNNEETWNVSYSYLF